MARKRTRSEVWTALRRFYGYFTTYKSELATIFCLLLLFSFLELVQPRLLGRIIDLATKAQPWREIVVMLVWFGSVKVARTGVLLARNYLIQRIGMRITCDMRVEVFSHLQKLSLRFYEARHTGKIVARVTEDTGVAHQLVTGASVNLLSDAVTIVGVLVFLVWQSPILALITYAVLPFFVFNYLWHKRRMRLESRQHRRNWDKVIGFLHERIASNRVVKAFATEDREIDFFRRGIENDYVNYNRVVWRNTLLGTMAELISGVGITAVLAYGSWLAYHHIDNFTVGDLVAFVSYLGMLYAPIVRMVDANAIIQRAVTALEKIYAVMDTVPHVPDNDRLPALPRVRGEVAFDHVSFSYRPSEGVIQDVTFTAKPGQMVALVGPSGAGKSTIISLLARFYDPVAGRITIDGTDIRSCNTQSVRGQIGVVMQDNVLFSGTIEENLKYGRRDATQEEMIAAAKAANAHEFIVKLSGGYQSKVGERGVQLSGGQRQRIAIARVILKDPRILIFDEATSALDTQSERLIQEAADRVLKGRTSFVIAHRLSTIVNADQILVMRAGAIVERGTHAELLAQGGLYRELHDLQFAKARAAH